jgi:hypothetical protein
MRLEDTNDPALDSEAYAFGSVYTVTGRSLLVFLLERDGLAGMAERRRRRGLSPARPPALE